MSRSVGAEKLLDLLHTGWDSDVRVNAASVQKALPELGGRDKVRAFIKELCDEGSLETSVWTADGKYYKTLQLRGYRAEYHTIPTMGDLPEYHRYVDHLERELKLPNVRPVCHKAAGPAENR